MDRVPRILASVILSAALALPAHAEFNDVRRTLADSNATVWLEDATIYCVPTGATVTIDCGSGSGSGIDFADNAYLAAINIPANSTLKVVGANGSGSTPGRAGIHLPPGTSLVVFGDGTLEVQGGKAGNGGKGSDGGNGVIHSCDSDSCSATGGTGSAGGAGGGGAGAGIGGNGGIGASASSSVEGLWQN